MNWDYTLFARINGLAGHHQVLDLVMRGMAKYGVFLYVIYLLYLWFRTSRTTSDKKLVLKAVLAALIALLINQVIGLVYFRPRPFVHHSVNMLITKSMDPSFPSDHATGSSALTATVACAGSKLGILMIVTTLVLMISRVYVGTHYPGDVLGGALTGILGGIAANFFWPHLDKFSEMLIGLYNRFIPA